MFSIEIDSPRPSSAVQSDFSEIVKLGLGHPPQCGNEVQRYRIDDAVVADVLVFLGIANLQISAVSRE